MTPEKKWQWALSDGPMIVLVARYCIARLVRSRVLTAATRQAAIGGWEQIIKQKGAHLSKGQTAVLRVEWDAGTFEAARRQGTRSGEKREEIQEAVESAVWRAQKEAEAALRKHRHRKACAPVPLEATGPASTQTLKLARGTQWGRQRAASFPLYYATMSAVRGTLAAGVLRGPQPRSVKSPPAIEEVVTIKLERVHEGSASCMLIRMTGEDAREMHTRLGQVLSELQAIEKEKEDATSPNPIHE